MPHLSNAPLVVTRHAGHQDFVPGEKELRYQFMLSGKVDTSIIQHRTFSFEPSIDFSTIINLALLAFFVVAALLLWLAFYLVRRF
ncbi:MAG: hypothetical protein GY835_02565, partial [bacterium]|nr:hypothetical protein [bacterium]